MLVFTLKRIDPITLAHPLIQLPSAVISCSHVADEQRTVISHTTASISHQVFYTFRSGHSFKRDSNNWTLQEAAHRQRRRLSPSGFHRKLRRSNTNPRKTFSLSEYHFGSAGWSRAKRLKPASVLPLSPNSPPLILHLYLSLLVGLAREPRNELSRPVVTSKNLSSLSLLIYSTCHAVSCTVPFSLPSHSVRA